MYWSSEILIYSQIIQNVLYIFFYSIYMMCGVFNLGIRAMVQWDHSDLIPEKLRYLKTFSILFLVYFLPDYRPPPLNVGNRFSLGLINYFLLTCFPCSMFWKCLIFKRLLGSKVNHWDKSWNCYLDTSESS